MDLTIVAVYTICDDLLISIGHQESIHKQRCRMLKSWPPHLSLRDISEEINKPPAPFWRRSDTSRICWDTRAWIVGCIGYLNSLKCFLNTSQKVRKRKILMAFMSLIPFQYLSATTFGFHVPVSIKVKSTIICTLLPRSISHRLRGIKGGVFQVFT